MRYGVAESMEAFPFFLPEQALFFAPAIVTGSLRSSGEFLRGHGTEMTSVLMQSLAEFLEDLDGFSIAGCGRFCAQVTNAIFESAAGHHEYNCGNACMRVDFLYCSGQQNGFRKMYGRLCGKAARQYRAWVVPADHASAEIADDVSIACETHSHSRVSETLCGRTYEF